MIDPKRLFDLGASACAALVFAPVLPVLAAAIALDDGGPVLFVQERIGHHRKGFRIVKLRTMRDGRVTRVGRWLRATGLDELPQFVNVVRGEMSVVGPRPLTAHDVHRLGWDTSHDARFAIRPGIVGIAQVLGARTARHTAHLDALYARRASLALDASLVLAGFVANVAGKHRMRAVLGLDHGRRARREPLPASRDRGTMACARVPT
ncbi:MAG: sugar transferase [Sandaracinaceae bacterium]|nr:sugar transferase [Sandaracinaceae bacterium]